MALRLPSGAFLRRTATVPTFTNFSFGCFIRPTANDSNYHAILCWDAGSGDANCGVLQLKGGGSSYQLNYFDGSTFSEVAQINTPTLTATNWYYVGISVNGTGAGAVTTYLRPVSSSTLSTATGSRSSVGTQNRITIGEDPFAEPLVADILGAKLWQATLTTADHLAESYIVSPYRWTSLWAYYRFASTSDVNDASGNGRNLTVTGAPTLQVAAPAGVRWRRQTGYQSIASGATAATKTASGNAVVQGAFTKTASANAVVQASTTKSASANAVVKGDVVKTASGNAVIQSATTKTASGNAVIQGTATKTASANAVVKGDVVKTATANAVVQATTTKTASANASIAQRSTLTASANAVVQASQTKTASANAVVQTSATKTATGNAVIQSVGALSASVNAVVQARQTLSASANAVVSTPGANAVSADANAVIQGSATRTTSANAVIALLSTLSASGNTVVEAVQTKTTNADAVVQASATKSATANALVAAAQTVSASGNVVVQGTLSVSASANAVVVLPVGLVQASASAVIQGTFAKTALANAVISDGSAPPEADEASIDEETTIADIDLEATEADVDEESTYVDLEDATMGNWFAAKKGDTLRDLKCTLKKNGTAINLGTSGVTFRMRAANSTSPSYKFTGTATILDATNGRVSYSWQASDVDTPGEYYGEFVITSTGKTDTVPNGATGKGYVVVRIYDSLKP